MTWLALSARPYGLEGGKTSKDKRAEKEVRRRASRSALIKELAQELGEAPEELGGDEGDMTSAFAKREYARMEARAKVEEDLFTRVPLSKVERRRAKATTRSMNSLSAVGDFGDDVADLVEVAEELEGKKRQRLVDAVSMGTNVKRVKPDSGELDVPMRDTLGVSHPNRPSFLLTGGIFISSWRGFLLSCRGGFFLSLRGVISIFVGGVSVTLPPHSRFFVLLGPLCTLSTLSPFRNT